MISGKPAMLSDKSDIKKSMGDEAGCAPLKGVVTHKITGTVFFESHATNVKIEGECVNRTADLTTNNHAGKAPGQTPPWPFVAGMGVAVPKGHPCEGDIKKEEDACKGKNKEEACESGECQSARKCKLTPYKPKKCCKGQTGHHLVEVHGLCKPGKPRGRPMAPFDGSNGKNPYDQNKAPVVCASCPRGSRYYQEHGDLHAVQGIKENAAIAKAVKTGTDSTQAWNYGEARQAGVDAHSATFPESKCNEDCIASQLDAYHKDEVGASDSSKMRTDKVKFKKNDPDQQARGADLIKDLDAKRWAEQTSSAL